MEYYSYKEILQNYPECLVVVGVAQRNHVGFATRFTLLATAKTKQEAKKILDLYLGLSVEAVMIETFSSGLRCHITDGQLVVDNLEPEEVARCFRSIFNLENKRHL